MRGARTRPDGKAPYLIAAFDHGADRRLNRALHMAVITRMAHDPDTRAYVERRRAEGRTTREIRRCLKRYLARQLYRTLERLHTKSDAYPQAA